jgi:hypothetical protein
MTIDKNKIRKEVHLTQDILDILQKQADTEGRSMKNLMEFVLIQYSKTLKK